MPATYYEVTGEDYVGVQAEYQELRTKYAGMDVDFFDAHKDKGKEIAAAAGVIGLFSSDKLNVVRSPHALSVTHARTIHEKAATGSVYVFIGEKPLTAAVRKALAGVQVITKPLPSRRTGPTWVKDKAAAAGVTVNSGEVDRLGALATTKAGAARVSKILDVTAKTGCKELSAQQARDLTGDLDVPQQVWFVVDSICRGDVAASVLPDDAEPIPVASMLATRLMMMTALAEGADPGEYDMTPAVVRLSKSNKAPLSVLQKCLSIALDCSAQCREIPGVEQRRLLCSHACTDIASRLAKFS